MTTNTLAISGVQRRFGLLAAFEGAVARFNRRRQLARARAELHRLSDAELADIGIARSDIARVVETGRR
ncbi:MAG: DUF1127 domain-containing protein [Marivibrio sp.]|uniref:DUF1127 domain-containing protein n=1 Tax=Marivibrio sp. TaxID=2039719 RepID=UPI0032EE83B6